MQHHFVAAVVPTAKRNRISSISRSRVRSICSVPWDRYRAFRLAARARSARRCSSVRSYRPSWSRPDRDSELVADYGKLTFIAKPPVRAAELGTWAGGQLGLVDHHRHCVDQAALLLAQPGERQINGENARPHAAHQEHPGALQRRSRAARLAQRWSSTSERRSTRSRAACQS